MQSLSREAPSTATTVAKVQFKSKKLTATEQNYSAQEREMLAAMHYLRNWRHIVDGQELFIRSNHQSLTRFRTKTDVLRKLPKLIIIACPQGQPQQIAVYRSDELFKIQAEVIQNLQTFR
jgi:hypothetical protein